MANETTSTSLDEIINSEWIVQAFQDYAHDWAVGTRFAIMKDLRGKGSAKVALPRIKSDMGTVSASGDGVDTEYDASEGTDLGNTELELEEATCQVSEYGIMRTLADEAREDSIDGFDLLNAIIADSARILQTALEDDFCGLFPSLSNSQGSSGNDATLTNLSDCISGIRNAGVRAPGGLVAVLDDEQVGNLEAEAEGTDTDSQVMYPEQSRDMMRLQPDDNNGLTDGRVFRYKNTDVYQTGLTDTVNTDADVCGAVFVNAGMPVNEPFAAFIHAMSRPFTSELERDASLRATEIVCSRRDGVAIAYDPSAQKLVTDAP